MAASKMTKPWVNGPYQLLETPGHARGGVTPSIHTANEMAQAHNMFTRGLNAIILQAPHISTSNPTDVKDFMIFCSCWIETVHHHHTLEEENLFPDIERACNAPGIMAINVSQHAAFEIGLKAFDAYVNETQAEPGRYSAEKMDSLIQAFAPALMKHLTEEVQTLLELSEKVDPDGSKVNECFAKLEKIAVKLGDKSRVLPIAIGCTDQTFENEATWPAVPFFVPYLVDWVFARKYRGAWRFCPSDFHGRPRDLAFLG